MSVEWNNEKVELICKKDFECTYNHYQFGMSSAPSLSRAAMTPSMLWTEKKTFKKGDAYVFMKFYKQYRYSTHHSGNEYHFDFIGFYHDKESIKYDSSDVGEYRYLEDKTNMFHYIWDYFYTKGELRQKKIKSVLDEDPDNAS